MKQGGRFVPFCFRSPVSFSLGAEPRFSSISQIEAELRIDRIEIIGAELFLERRFEHQSL